MAQKPTRLGLTRDQLASFLNDFEQIKQFEKLFASVDQITTVSLDDVTIAAENAAATANDALAQIADLSLQTELLSLAPPDLGGTVTSVGLSAGSTGLTVAGPNPITTSGAFTLGGILNVANGGTGTSTAFTQGSIIFAGASGVYSQDNANLNWDDTNNTLGVGRIASPNSRVVAKGGTTGNGSFQFYSENSASVGCFGVRDDGGFFTGQAASSPYNVTTSSPANVFVGADGYLYRSTSTAGTGTVTSVDVSGGTTGLTTSGGPITTSGTITIAGTLNVANGGTGATTATAARANLGAAASGANSDITSLSGITGGIATPDYIDFDTTATVTRATGRLWWDSADGIQTLNLGMAGSNATLQIGEEMYFRIKASSAITEGQVVMFTGSVGNSGALTGAPATGLTKDTASYIMGVATEDIALNGWGYVTQFGLVRNINTTGGAEAWVDGQILYYNPAVSGGLTKNVPSAPNAKVEVAAVVNAASNGSLFVRPIARFSLGQLNDVETSAAANGDLIQYNSGAGYWQHSAPSTISVGTATNLAGGAANRIAYQTGAGTTGFIVAPTIANTFLEWSGSAFQWSSNPLGTVTSVDVSGGTTGLTTTGGPITTSGTITLGGTLNVANGGTGATSLTSGYLLKGNGTSAVSASVAYDNGSALLIGTTFNKNRLTVTAATNVNAPTLGAAGGIAYFTNTDVAYGLNIGNSAVDGRVWLQSQRTDGSAIAYNLTLNEAGGNVAIGKSTAATALDVNGTVTATSFTGAGTGLTGTASALSIGGNAATATTATSATTAGSVTNSVTFNNSGAGDASGTSFNGSVARTISYNTIGAQPAGTYVTSVGATAPVVSSGGTTPTISMAAATGSVNGYLTSTDWTTFNSKQAALVSGTNIKTVNGTSLLGSGDVGTIATGYGGTGLTSFTANGIMYASSTSALATSSALTFNGTNFATTGTASATKLIPTGGTAAGNGMYLPATNALAFSTNGSERARFTSAGGFLVNTTSPAAGNWFSEIKFTGADVWPLALNANNRGLIVRNSAATSGFYAYFEYNGGTANGSISWSGGTTAFNTTSDARIKDNIVDAPEAGDLIDGIKVRSWDFKVDGAHWRYGMVAQELLEVVPEAVSVPSDDTIMMGVDYSKLVPMLIKEVQSLRRRVAELEGN